MRKITLLSLTFAFLLQALFVGQSFGNTDEEKRLAKIRTGIAKLGTGPEAKIKVTLKNKTKIEGYVVSSDADNFVVMNSKSGQAEIIPYPQAKQVKGNNLSTGVKILIGVGIAIAFIIFAASQLK